MAVKAVFFDVGETLVNESLYWEEHAERIGVPPHVLWAALGAVIERGEHHRRVFATFDFDPEELPEVVYRPESLYPDALPCLTELRQRGLFVGIAGNQTAALEQWARTESLPADLIGSSASWGVEKPSPGFFARVVSESGCEPQEVAYVGDRVDNDVLPALEAGLVAVHLRRGPWGFIQKGAEQAHIRLDSLAELPQALADV